MRAAHVSSAAAAAVLIVSGLVVNAQAPDSVIAHAKVWHRTEVPAMNLRTGPTGPGSFAPGATITCTYHHKDFTGRSPKFACRLADGDELKVKYGGAEMTIGEVYGEVAASRLLWAIGFGADRMYPVRVICHKCPKEMGGIERSNGDRIIDPAAVERKLGRELVAGWAWEELDRVDEAQGGATKAERDALKLLAVFLQHTDEKPVNQRIVCLDGATGSTRPCAEPLMMIDDLGITFGHGSRGHQQPRGSVNLKAWTEAPIWKDAGKCVANLDASGIGALRAPVISEAGRKFLGDLLSQLSDQQLRDLFDTARVALRPPAPPRAGSTFATVDEWVAAFRKKRAEIVAHRCPA